MVPLEWQYIPPVLGIDLGTSYSRVAVMRSYGPEAIPDGFGHRAIPSWVSFPRDGGALVGETAKRAPNIPYGNCFFNPKSIIGRTMNDSNVQHGQENSPLNPVSQADLSRIQIQRLSEVVQYSPEEIVAEILRELKDMAEKHLGDNITQAVIAVPTYYKKAQRRAISDAGAIAGLDILGIINEPMAAAAMFSRAFRPRQPSYLMVYDLGGTSTVSLLRMNGAAFNIVATTGSTDTGGEAFDHRLVDYFVALYRRRTGVDVRGDASTLKKLKHEVELAKRALSTRTSVDLFIESFHGGNNFSERLTRDEFEELNMDLFLKTTDYITEVLKLAEVQKEDVTEFTVVGGSTRILKVQSLVRDFFGGKPPFKLPNPEEEVALGAAVYGQFLSHRYSVDGFVFGDTSARSLGVRTPDGAVTEMIPIHSVVPALVTHSLSTTAEGGTTFKLQVTTWAYRPDLLELLQTVELAGITLAPSDPVQINVTFSIDSIGGLTVSAANGKSAKSVLVTPADLATSWVESRKENAYQWMESLTRLHEYIFGLKTDLIDLKKLGGRLLETDRRAVWAVVEDVTEWLHRGIRDVEREVIDEKLAEVRGLVAIFTGPYIAQVCSATLHPPWGPV